MYSIGLMSDPSFQEEYNEWLEALDNVILSDGKEYASSILEKLFNDAAYKGLLIKPFTNPSFRNSVSSDEELPYPGDWELEQRIRSIIRWNSLLMVLKANENNDLGGHISTYSSASTLYEVGFGKGSDIHRVICLLPRAFFQESMQDHFEAD